jgi:hypothetical protein
VDKDTLTLKRETCDMPPAIDSGMLRPSILSACISSTHHIARFVVHGAFSYYLNDLLIPEFCT